MKLGLAKLLDKTIGTCLCYLLAFLFNRPLRSVYSPHHINRILIEKLIAVGDVIVALPTIHAVRKQFPHAYIALLVTPRVRDVVEGNPDVDEIIYYDLYKKEKGLRGFFSIVAKVRKQRFDLVLELTHYHRIVSLVTWMSGIPHRAGFAIPGQGRNKLLTIPVAYDTGKHEVETFLDVACAAGVKCTPLFLQEIAVSGADKTMVQECLARENVQLGEKFILIQPGTSALALSRRWAPEKWAELANRLNREGQGSGVRGQERDARRYPVIFCGSIDEVPIFAEIQKHLNFTPGNLIGKLTLKQTAWLFKHAILFIGLDTGTTHLAAAMGTRVLALYGPNTPLKWGPYGSQHRVIYKALSCSPCTKQYLGQVSTCENNICMQQITVEEVVETAMRFILDFGF